MKRIVLLILVLGLLSLGAYFLVSQGEQEKKTSLTKNDRDFRIENIEDVALIKIRTRRRPELHLSKKGRDWLVNYKHVVSPNSMGRLLEVMEDMRMKYIPHKNALPNIKDEMELIGLHIEVFDANNNKLKGYYVGGGTADERGTYVQMEGSDQPYVMEMASYEGSIRGRFMPKPEEWRDRIFIKENIDQISKITVDYPKSKEDSFVLDATNKTVAPLYGYSLKKAGKLKKPAIQAYLKHFENIGAEAFENHHKDRDSIAALVPFAKFMIENKNGETKEISLFPIKDLYFQDVNTTSVDQTARIERYFADCSWGDFMMVQHILAKKILLPIDFFFDQ